MSKSWNRPQTWIALILLPIGLLIAAILGLWAYVGATTTPLHPSLQDVPSVARSAPPPRWADAVRQARQTILASVVERNLPGVSVAVGAGGEIVWAEGFGWADLENRVRVTPETRFRIGTASTALTSAAAGLLLEKGSLKLDDEIQAYVPEYPKKQWPMRVRQVMGHVAGIVPDEGDEEPLTVHCERTIDGLERFAETDLLFEPGTQYRFSSYGWILMSAAIEAAAKEPFFTFMRKHVFEPLGMNDTKVDDTLEPTASEGAIFYFPRFAADTRYGPQEPREVDYSCFSGSSAFLSTPSDLVRFGLAMQGGKLLQPDTVQLLQTPLRLTSGQETGYGLGWDLKTVTLAGQQTRLAGHDGRLMGGMAASLIAIPAQGIVVSMTSNIPFTDTFALGMKVAEVFAAQGQPQGGAKE